MLINDNQKKILNKILKQYRLKKDLESLTTLEASIVIEGIYNNGKVKDTFKNKKLSDESFKRKQLLFDSLIEKVFIPATEGQLNYLNKLLSKSKFSLVSSEVAKDEVTPLISFLTKGIKNEVSEKLLKEESYDNLIKENIVVNKKDNFKFPENWNILNIELSGIVDFKK